MRRCVVALFFCALGSCAAKQHEADRQMMEAHFAENAARKAEENAEAGKRSRAQAQREAEKRATEQAAKDAQTEKLVVRLNDQAEEQQRRNEAFQTLEAVWDALPESTSLGDVPVLVGRPEVLTDDMGRHAVSVVLLPATTKPIDAVEVDITALDAFDRKLDCLILGRPCRTGAVVMRAQRAGLDLQLLARHGVEWDLLGYLNPVRAEVSLVGVRFADGTTWRGRSERRREGTGEAWIAWFKATIEDAVARADAAESIKQACALIGATDPADAEPELSDLCFGRE